VGKGARNPKLLFEETVLLNCSQISVLQKHGTFKM